MMEYSQYEFFDTTTPAAGTAASGTTTPAAAATTATTTPAAAATTATTTPAAAATTATTTPAAAATTATTTPAAAATTATTKPTILPVYYDKYGNRIYYDHLGKKYNFDINNPPNANLIYPPPYYDKYGNRVYYDSNGVKRSFDTNNPPNPSNIYPPPVNKRDDYDDHREHHDRDRDNSDWTNWGWNSNREPYRKEIDITLTRDGDHRRGYYDNQAIYTSAGWSVFGIFVSILVLVWFIAGITAFFASFICLFYNGSVTDKTIGILLGLFLGPFYWLYYIYNINYCTKY